MKCGGSLVQECQELSKKLNSAISTIVDVQTDDLTGKLFQDSFKVAMQTCLPKCGVPIVLAFVLFIFANVIGCPNFRAVSY